MIDDLLNIACTGQAWSADAALDVLIDVTTSFDLSPELARDDEDVRRFKRSLIAAVATRRAQVTQLAASAAHHHIRGARPNSLGHRAMTNAVISDLLLTYFRLSSDQQR